MYFPDSCFRKYVLEVIDTDKDGVLTEEECLAVKIIGEEVLSIGMKVDKLDVSCFPKLRIFNLGNIHLLKTLLIYPGGRKIEKVVIPSGVKVIGQRAFCYNMNIKSV